MRRRGGAVLKRACGELAHASGSIGLEAIAVTARFGLDAALPDILMARAASNGGQDCSHPYGARFTDLRVFSELPSLYPEAEAQARSANPSRCRSEASCAMDFPAR